MNPKLADDWLNTPIADTDELFTQFARKRQMQLTKPPESLGRLEAVAIWQRYNIPRNPQSTQSLLRYLPVTMALPQKMSQLFRNRSLLK